MTDNIFNQAVTINKTNTATVFAIENQQFSRALVEFTFGMSKFQVHLTPAEAVQLATVLNDSADWIQSEASRKEARTKQAEQDRIPAGASPVEARFLMGEAA